MLQDIGNQLGSYFQLPNPRLMAYLGRVQKGDPSVIETPFAEGQCIHQLLEEWMAHLVKLDSSWPTLLSYEKEMMLKVGPLSYQKPLVERLESIEDYFTDVNGKFRDIEPRAIKAVISEFSHARGLMLRSPEKTLANMKLSTNSGNPYFVKRREVAETLHNWKLVKTLTSGVIQEINDTIWSTCAVLGWRGQEGGPAPSDVKQRVVFMFPFLVNLAELMFYQVGIEAVQRFNLIPAYVSMDNVDKEITALFKSSEDEYIMCTDFTSFDSHFNYTLQNCAREIISAIITPSREGKNWLDVVYPIKYNIPLLINEHEVYFGIHGMGSGSGGTNFDESLAHRALQYEAAMSQGKYLNIHSMCLGDDGILSYPGIDLDRVIKSYSQHGLEMNESKQSFDKNTVVYLRRWHNRYYQVKGINVGVYPTMRALGRLRYQERYYNKWSNKMVALRQLSILENVKFHPLREEFVGFCMKRDKYRLGIDIPGFLDQIDSEAKQATAYMPDFLGYTKSIQEEVKPSTWWIIRYLKSLK